MFTYISAYTHMVLDVKSKFRRYVSVTRHDVIFSLLLHCERLRPARLCHVHVIENAPMPPILTPLFNK